MQHRAPLFSFALGLSVLTLAGSTLAAPKAAILDASTAMLTARGAVDEPVVRDGDFHPSQVLVRFDASLSEKAQQQALDQAGVLEVLTRYEIVPGLLCVRVEPGTVDAAIASLSKAAGVMYAERDYYRFTMAQTRPYGVDLVRAPQVWPVSRGNAVRVAVLDTGVDFNHPDLPDPVVSQSFISGQTAQDNNNHGTHCSGTVLAIDNTDGVIGVAPNAILMIGKVLADSGSGPTSGIISGVQWAQANQAKVISMSLGGTAFNQSFSDACQAAVNAGVFVVAAAGNGGTSTPNYPGAYDSVFCVASVNSSKVRASSSSFGPHVDISAPGVGVLSTVSTSVLTTSTTAEWNNTLRTVTPLTGSGTGVVSAEAIHCGVGNVADFPAGVSGKIAHIRRGGQNPQGANLTFQAKVNNAIAAGAIGVIISNNVTGSFGGTLNQTVNIPVVAVSQASGDELQNASPAFFTTITNTATGSTYASFSGTSMATPHVAGVGALLIGAAGNLSYTPAQIRQAIEETAEDLGTVGKDDLYGNGLVRADSAVNLFLTLITPPTSCPADIALDDGTPRTLSGSSASNSGVNEGDYNAFFSVAGFFNQAAGGVSSIGDFCDIAYDDGTQLNTPTTATNNGVNEGDYNLFFNTFFLPCN